MPPSRSGWNFFFLDVIAEAATAPPHFPILLGEEKSAMMTENLWLDHSVRFQLPNQVAGCSVRY